MRVISIGIAIAAVGLLDCRPVSAADGGFELPGCGDLNGDETVNLSDALHLLNYLFQGGPAPTCTPASVEPTGGSCSRSAHLVAGACRDEALAEFQLSSARCANLESPDEVAGCIAAAREELDEALDACEAQLEARLEICETLGEDPYRPVIDPARFVETIDHPYFPLSPGTTFLYEKETVGGTERIAWSVTPEKREILGVDCAVVRETETFDGLTVEEKVEWFAQDVEGNVWRFGEKSTELEGGEVIRVEDSWEAGVDGAQPGVAMPAAPAPEDLHREEFLLAEAEDVARVVSLGASVEVPHGSFAGCLETEVLSPIEPDLSERRFFAPGLGLVLEVDLQTGERVELVDVFEAGDPGPFEDVGLRLVYSRADDSAQVEVTVEAEMALEHLQLFGPDGRPRVALDSRDLGQIGQSGFCIKTPEPSLTDILEAYPEGVYRVVGRTVEGAVLVGETVFSHDLLEAPVITFPAAGGERVSRSGLTGEWRSVENAARYRVELEEEGAGVALEADLPAASTSFSFPSQWLLPHTQYRLKVEAIGENRNRTLTELRLTTAD